MSIKNNIEVIYKSDAAYPPFLSELDDAPEKLYCIGDLNLLNKKSVAVVGARKCSEYGRQVAMLIGKVLATNDVVTVSGMAQGIDSVAHSSALKNNGKTIAVLGTGPDICYPKYNRYIYEEICNKGLVISEYEPGTLAKPWHFPRRNRIISAISDAVVVVEASANSGSLITSEYAAEQGKEILAVPGNINSVYSLGCNKLICDGATIVAVPEDILRAIGISPNVSKEALKSMGSDERRVFDVLNTHGEVSIEYMCRVLGEDPSKISGIVAVMEIKGLVSYNLGKIYIAKF